MATRLDAKVEIAFPTPPRSTSPIWVDVTDTVRGIRTTKRGRQHELNEFQAGAGELTLDNSDRTYDPTYTASKFWPNVRPMRRCRISGVGPMPATLTGSGNEITDATRTTNTQGDGRAAPDSSFGIWEATTNLCTNGGFETDITTGWGALGLANPGTRDTGAFKFGTASCKVTRNAGVAGFLGRQTSSMTVTATQTYTASVRIKLGTAADTDAVVLIREVTGGAGTTSKNASQYDLIDANGWRTISVTRTMGAGVTAARIEIYHNAGGGGTPAEDGETFWFDGVQFEQKPIATPYVHTDGATATRSAAKVALPTNLLGISRGWVAIRVRVGAGSTVLPDGSRAFDSRSTANGNIATIRWNSGPANWSFAGAGSAIGSAADSFGTGDMRTLVGMWDAALGVIGISVGGAPFVRSATGALEADIAQATIGCFNSPTAHFDGDVLWFACGTGTLGDGTANGRNDVQTLFRLGNTDPNFSVLPQSAQITAAMPFNTTAYTALTSVPKFTGYVMEWPPDWSGLDYSETTVQLVDGIGTLSMSPIVGAFSQQLTGARITAVLDAVGWPAGERVVSTGLSLCAAVTFLPTDKQMAWQHILDVARTENGLAFIDAQGRFVFRDRQTQLTAPYTTSQFTFDDAGTPGQLFDDLVPTEEDDLLWNSVTVTDSSGAASTVIDSTAQDEYWPRSLPISTLLPAGSAEAADHAVFELSQFKDPYVRYKSLQYIPSLNDTLATQTLTREIGDRITIKKTPPGPPPQVVADAVIQSIEDEWVPGGGDAPPTWTTVYELSGAISTTYATFDGTAIFDDPGAKFAY